MSTALAGQENRHQPTVSVFENAKNPHFENSSFTINNTTKVDTSIDPLGFLRAKVATNAILNAGGRADEVKCYPGTREELIGLVERWMDNDVDGATPNMMWLSGPAGAGKSAIVQTVAERCRERGVQAASFFFFRADSTRSSAGPLVPTLLYQIVKFHPDVRPAVASILSDDPLVFGSSIQDQFSQLLSSLLQNTPPPPKPPTRRPIVLLIDGLDECDSGSKQSQSQILQSLEYLLTQKDSPFLVLVASRAEPQISGAFNRLSCPVQTIFLDDQYQPEKDLQLFVKAKFDEIKKWHHLAHTLKEDWPSASDINVIVEKSSGQFIFAATVMRFIANSPSSPQLSLERVQGITPVEQNSPFAQLDAIYMYILSQAENQDAVRNLLSAELLARAIRKAESSTGIVGAGIFSTQAILRFFDPVKYPNHSIQSYVSDLAAILQLNGNNLVFYHASLTDFLETQTRSGGYYVDLDVFVTKIIPAVWKNGSRDVDGCCLSLHLVHLQQKPHPDTTNILKNSSKLKEYIAYYKFKRNFLGEIHRLYYPGDINTYKRILRRWISALVDHGYDGYDGTGFIRYFPYERRYLWFYKTTKWLRPYNSKARHKGT